MVYTMVDMKRTQIYLPKTQIDALRHLARERNETVSEMVRTLLRRQLEETDGFRRVQKQRRTPFDVLREITELDECGPKDLAVNLDKYLYGNK